MTVFNKMMEAGHGIQGDKLATADFIADIPGFKKGAAVVGVVPGRGSSPVAMATTGRPQS